MQHGKNFDLYDEEPWLTRTHRIDPYGVYYHESWIFPAGVSFALKQNMYWDGFCAFLPDISGLWGGGGGVFPVFTLLGNP